MASLAALIKNPEEHRRLINWAKAAVIIGILLFTLVNADDKVRVFVIIAGALYLFTTEKLPVDLTALTIMVILMIFGLVTPTEGVSGFANSATITVMAMFILSAGIERTGIIHTLGRHIFRFAGNSEIRQLIIIAMIVGPISGFINNTAAVAIMLPMVLDLAKRAKTSATKLLIPLSFLSMAGGMLTLVGTSTNILASSVLTDLHYPPIAIFEFSKLGLIVLLIAVAYFALIGRFLLPDRKNIEGKKENSIESEFLAEIIVEKGSPLIGKTLKTTRFLEKYDARLIKIIHGDQSFIKDAAERILEENDIIVLFADEQRLIDLDKNEKDGVKLLLDFDETRRKLPNSGGQILKVLVRSSTIFHKKSLAEIGFWRRFGAAVVGVHREDMSGKRLANMKLDIGEIFLIKASKTAVAEIQKSADLMVIETVQQEFNREKMWTALAIVVGVIAVSAFGLLPIMVSALAGIILMAITGCVDPREMPNTVSWDIIFLLAGIIPLGIALQKSGAADLVAGGLATVGGEIPPLALLMLFYLLTTLLTEIVSNNASVILIIPIAISVAEKLSYNPVAFALAVMFAASTSFLTPIGYQTNTMVFGAGNYKFSDFVKVGAPLNIILGITTSLLIAYFWGL